MLRWIYQTLAILAIACLATLTTYLVAGAPDRSVPCEQSKMQEDYVCLSHVLDAWEGDVVWVDARSAGEFSKSHLNGAIHISESDAETQLAIPKNMERIGMAGVEGRKLVVYCATDACGSSEFVANKIRETGFHSEVFLLHGGWKAILADARTAPNNQ